MGMCIMLNTCTDLSSHSLESRNVVLLVSWGRRGPTSELEAEPGPIMESRSRISVNQRRCVYLQRCQQRGSRPNKLINIFTGISQQGL